MAESLSLTIQPLDNDLDYAPSVNLHQQQHLFGYYGPTTYGTNYYGASAPYLPHPPPFLPTVNKFSIQGGMEASVNYTNRQRENARPDKDRSLPLVESRFSTTKGKQLSIWSWNTEMASSTLRLVLWFWIIQCHQLFSLLATGLFIITQRKVLRMRKYLWIGTHYTNRHMSEHR